MKKKAAKKKQVIQRPNRRKFGATETTKVLTIRVPFSYYDELKPILNKYVENFTKKKLAYKKTAAKAAAKE